MRNSILFNAERRSVYNKCISNKLQLFFLNSFFSIAHFSFIQLFSLRLSAVAYNCLCSSLTLYCFLLYFGSQIWREKQEQLLMWKRFEKKICQHTRLPQSKSQLLVIQKSLFLAVTLMQVSLNVIYLLDLFTEP